MISVELAEGKYDYTIMAVGYEPVQGELVVDKNVMHRDYIALKKATAKVNEGIA